MKFSDKKQFFGQIITAEEISLQFFENKSISQCFKKLPLFYGSIKTYTKFIVTNEPLLVNFALFHEYSFSRNDSFPNTFEPLYNGHPMQWTPCYSWRDFLGTGRIPFKLSQQTLYIVDIYIGHLLQQTLFLGTAGSFALKFTSSQQTQ